MSSHTTGKPCTCTTCPGGCPLKAYPDKTTIQYPTPRLCSACERGNHLED